MLLLIASGFFALCLFISIYEAIAERDWPSDTIPFTLLAFVGVLVCANL